MRTEAFFDGMTVLSMRAWTDLPSRCDASIDVLTALQPTDRTAAMGLGCTGISSGFVTDGLDMDPLSLGLAAAAFLATGFAEGFTEQIGADAWSATQRFVGRLRDRLTGRGREALDRIEQKTPSDTDPVDLGKEIGAIVGAESGLCQELQQLIDRASGTHRGLVVVQQAFDQARQINITGPNFGPITMGGS